MNTERLVIVADDDDDIRACVGDVLRDEGIDVRLARNGRAALDLLDVLGDDRCVLLLDLTMPIMSGFEVLQLLARAGRLGALPVIVCSALRELGPLPAGVRHVIRKTIDLERLLLVICEERAVRSVSEVRALVEPSREVSRPRGRAAASS